MYDFLLEKIGVFYICIDGGRNGFSSIALEHLARKAGVDLTLFPGDGRTMTPCQEPGSMKLAANFYQQNLVKFDSLKYVVKKQRLNRQTIGVSDWLCAGDNDTLTKHWKKEDFLGEIGGLLACQSVWW